MIGLCIYRKNRAKSVREPKSPSLAWTTSFCFFVFQLWRKAYGRLTSTFYTQFFPRVHSVQLIRFHTTEWQSQINPESLRLFPGHINGVSPLPPHMCRTSLYPQPQMAGPTHVGCMGHYYFQFPGVGSGWASLSPPWTIYLQNPCRIPISYSISSSFRKQNRNSLAAVPHQCHQLARRSFRCLLYEYEETTFQASVG